MYDAIVVGARCAGAPTAMLLARKGYKVLLVDRSAFPSDIPHGHFIHRHGPQRLARWGLLDRIVEDGCPAVTSWVLDIGDFPLLSSNLVENGIAFGYGPRRSRLDHVLVEAAADAGAEIREGFVVEDFSTDGDAISGVIGHERGSARQLKDMARITIGADGRNSTLAKKVAPDMSATAPTFTCWYFSYWSGVTGDALELYVRDKQVIFAFPTSDGLFAVFVAWPRDKLTNVRSDIETLFMAALDQVPELAERIRSGMREERFLGATDLPNFIRKPFGPGWALVGDAGCHKDPYMALGICDAFRDAELLADAIDAGLSRRSTVHDALAEYERLRNESTREDFERNMYQAQFLPPPEDLLGIRQALRRDPAASTLFTKVMEGLLPRERFFNPENLATLMQGSGAGRSYSSPA